MRSLPWTPPLINTCSLVFLDDYWIGVGFIGQGQNIGFTDFSIVAIKGFKAVGLLSGGDWNEVGEGRLEGLDFADDFVVSPNLIELFIFEFESFGETALGEPHLAHGFEGSKSEMRNEIVF